jgi:hypothetical protein
MHGIISILILTFSLCNCQKSIDISGVSIKWENRGSGTYFSISADVGTNNIISNTWLGISFNTQKQMSGGRAIICKNGDKKVEHNRNEGYSSSLLDSTNPSIGITDASITNVGRVITCNFTRANSNSNVNYYNIDVSPYIQVAYGSLTNSGKFVEI